MLLDKLRMKLDSSIGVAEDDSFILEMFQEAVVHNFGIVLGAYSCQEFLLVLGYAYSFEGLLFLILNVVLAILYIIDASDVEEYLNMVDVCIMAWSSYH